MGQGELQEVTVLEFVTGRGKREKVSIFLITGIGIKTVNPSKDALTIKKIISIAVANSK